MKKYFIYIQDLKSPSGFRQIEEPILYDGDIARYDYFTHKGFNYRVMDRRITAFVIELFCREVDKPLLEIKLRLNKIV